MPICVITVDLAGRTKSTTNLHVDTDFVHDTAAAVISECIVEGDRQWGGFGTIALKRTLDGMASAVPAPNGYGRCYYGSNWHMTDKY